MKALQLIFALALACGLAASSAQAQGMLSFNCEATARDGAMKSLRESSPTFDADLAAANTAIAIAAKLDEDTLAGRDVPAPYSGAARFAKLAAQAPSPELAELFRRTATDSLARYQTTIARTHSHWATGLTEPALAYAYRIVMLDRCGADEANTAWLKARLKVHGWFTIPDYGEDADQAAFTLIQHADRDPDFQAEILPQLEKLALEGKTRPARYAMLFDRVAFGQQRPQRYGSQGRCNGPGVWTAFETEDPANLDQRRATMGMPPEADYVAIISAQACKHR